MAVVSSSCDCEGWILQTNATLTIMAPQKDEVKDIPYPGIVIDPSYTLDFYWEVGEEEDHVKSVRPW
jgi:hypothetical protein